jgi:hypothetical protein
MAGWTASVTAARLHSRATAPPASTLPGSAPILTSPHPRAEPRPHSTPSHPAPSPVLTSPIHPASRALGVSRQTVNSIENDRYTPSLPLAMALARFFGVTVEEMFDDQGV